jgi:hypothetical protein
VDAHEHDLYIDQLRFRVACFERKGSEFQSFFERVMSMARPGFTTVAPWGSEGDHKCDGFLSVTGTVFQVYAPKRLVAARMEAKVRTDCDGAIAAWPPMREWVFVWSAIGEGLPPQVVGCFEQLRTKHPGLRIADWNQEALWRIIERELTPLDRARLFGPPPSVSGPIATSPVEIGTILNYLARQGDGVPTDDSFDLTDLRPKLAKNKLTERIEVLVRRAMPLAREVERYVMRSYDEDFAKQVGSHLIDRYRELSGAPDLSGDGVFLALVDFAAADRRHEEAYFWGAAAIVTYYFEICDIFER